MGWLKDTILDASVYNNLPRIDENFDVPKKFVDDLEYLRGLLTKHSVPDSVTIRLIHKHYNVRNGEVMTFRTIKALEGTIQVMQPMRAKECGKLHPIHYFVDNHRRLQAYEYTTDETPNPNLQNHELFLQDFCAAVADRGLQWKFGLKIRGPSAAGDSLADKDWREYELPSKRSTVIVPKGMPEPEGDPTGFSVNTEWPRSGPVQHGCHSHQRCYNHCRNHCNGHKKRGGDSSEDDSGSGSDTASSRTLGGKEIVHGSKIDKLMEVAFENW